MEGSSFVGVRGEWGVLGPFLIVDGDCLDRSVRGSWDGLRWGLDDPAFCSRRADGEGGLCRVRSGDK
jgi:hypothetical protein